MLRASAALGLCLVLPSCVGRTPTLEDSLGTVVQWTCEGHDCNVTGVSEPPPDCNGNDVFVVGAGAIAILCAATVATDHSFMLHDATCRPLRCNTPDDCPQWPDREYGCDGGFCTTASLALDMLDVEVTCLRNAPRLATCAEIDADPMVTHAMSVATTACASGPCTIPAECMP